MPDTLIKGYEELEKKFLERVKDDRDQYNDIVYLPAFLKPTRKVKYVFISMEPSLTEKWADPPHRNKAEAAIEGGFRNFGPGRFEDTILHYCVHKYLPANFNEYYITDMSKGAMPPQIADEARRRTWLNWFPLLKKELELVAEEDAQIFAIGRVVEGFLLGKAPKMKMTAKKDEYMEIVNWIEKHFHGKPKYLPHHAPTNRGYWPKYIKEKNLVTDYDAYKLTEDTLTEDKLLEFSKTLLSYTHTGKNLKEFCMKGLGNQKFNDTLIKMGFVYKTILEKKRPG